MHWGVDSRKAGAHGWQRQGGHASRDLHSKGVLLLLGRAEGAVAALQRDRWSQGPRRRLSSGANPSLCQRRMRAARGRVC